MEHLVIELDDVIVDIYIDSVQAEAILKEAAQRKGQPLIGPYSYQKHGPHVTPGQQHLHVYKQQDKLFAINWDGSAHDQSHSYRIPNKVYKAIQQEFPDLALPPSQIIESLTLSRGHLVKTASSVTFAEQIDLLGLLLEFEGQE